MPLWENVLLQYKAKLECSLAHLPKKVKTRKWPSPSHHHPLCGNQIKKFRSQTGVYEDVILIMHGSLSTILLFLQKGLPFTGLQREKSCDDRRVVSNAWKIRKEHAVLQTTNHAFPKSQGQPTWCTSTGVGTTTLIINDHLAMLTGVERQQQSNK